MGKIFDMDSPVMRFLSRMADLMILNVVMTVCCLPIITIGASVTAMHYVMLKLVRKEEGYIVKDFFKSFKQNFKQATIIWLIMLVFIFVFVGDYLIINYSGIEFPQNMAYVLTGVAMLLFVVSTYIFPVLSHFDNTIKNTIKNGCIMSIMAAPKALLMALFTVAPVLLIFVVPALLPLVLLFGISFPAYLSAMLYSGTFRKFEPEVEPPAPEEEFHVRFDDEDEVPVLEENEEKREETVVSDEL